MVDLSNGARLLLISIWAENGRTRLGDINAKAELVEAGLMVPEIKYAPLVLSQAGTAAAEKLAAEWGVQRART